MSVKSIISVGEVPLDEDSMVYAAVETTLNDIYSLYWLYTRPIKECRVSNDQQQCRWVSRWVSRWVGEWVSEWVSRWVSEWVSEWVSKSPRFSFSSFLSFFSNKFQRNYWAWKYRHRRRFFKRNPMWTKSLKCALILTEWRSNAFGPLTTYLSTIYFEFLNFFF